MKESVNYTDEEITLGDRLAVHNFDFHSDAGDLLPGGKNNPDDYEFHAASDSGYDPDIIGRIFNRNDAQIPENIDFRYHVFRPAGREKLRKAIFFFHGFNEKNWVKYFTWAARLADSRLCMFCGGAVFNRLSPVSKFILDSEADVSLYSFVVEHLESHMKRDPVMKEYLGTHPEGMNFRCMLDYNILREYRESLFRKMAGRMMAVVLKQDSVIPPYEVINTLQGAGRNIPIPVDTMDFPYSYKHEDPFPARTAIASEVESSFSRTFDRFCRFLA